MLIAHIEGATRVLGESQGYRKLPVRDELVNGTSHGSEAPCMVTAWTPTPEELILLNAGASVHVCIMGTAHPPIVVGVGDAPKDG